MFGRLSTLVQNFLDPPTPSASTPAKPTTLPEVTTWAPDFSLDPTRPLDEARRLSSGSVVAGILLANAKQLQAQGLAHATSQTYQLNLLGYSPVRLGQESSLLVLGPPRSGKTLGLLVPNVMAWQGPTVCVSTKSDALELTYQARSAGGECWTLEIGGTEGEHTAGKQLKYLKWSPVVGCEKWEQALRTADAIVSAGSGMKKGSSVSDAAFWAERGAALLAPLLFAAALCDQPVRTVAGWVRRRQLKEALNVLDEHKSSAATIAYDTLSGLSGARELPTHWSTVDGALAVYRSEEALRSGDDCNFDFEAFLHSQDTIYINAPGDRQAELAPIIVAFLAQLVARRFQPDFQSDPSTTPRLLLAIDELANVAPLPKLASIVSQAGGLGVNLICCLQDLSQARGVWGEEANGFMTLFNAKAILPGIADVQTLNQVSSLLGEVEHQIVERESTNNSGPGGGVSTNERHRTERRPTATPADLSRLRDKTMLLLQGSSPSLCQLLSYYDTPPYSWISKLGGAHEAFVEQALECLRVYDAVVESAVETVLPASEHKSVLATALTAAIENAWLSPGVLADMAVVSLGDAETALGRGLKDGYLQWGVDRQSGVDRMPGMKTPTVGPKLLQYFAENWQMGRISITPPNEQLELLFFSRDIMLFNGNAGYRPAPLRPFSAKVAEMARHLRRSRDPARSHLQPGQVTLLLLLLAPGPEIAGMSRLTRLMFLAEKDADFTADANFPCIPYKYGPFSRELYDELRALRDAGLVEVTLGTSPEDYVSAKVADVDDPGGPIAARNLGIVPSAARQGQWVFRLTPRGASLAEKLDKATMNERRLGLANLKERYGRMSLDELLSIVFERFDFRETDWSRSFEHARQTPVRDILEWLEDARSGGGRSR